MTFKALQEMLELNEASGLISSFRSGYRQGERDMRQAKTRVRDENARAKAALKQGELTDIADDINEFLESFFSNFPAEDAKDGKHAESLLKKYQSPEAHQVALNAYKAISERINQLRTGMNSSLLTRGKVTADQARTMENQARRMMGTAPPALRGDLIRFVRNEAKFFQRLVRVKDNTELNDNEFKTMLALKMNQTDDSRKYDAAVALNLLLGYMTKQFKLQAANIERAIQKRADDERKQRVSNRGPDGRSEVDIPSEGGQGGR